MTAVAGPDPVAAHLRGVRAVLFDIDHTVVDTAAGFARALEGSLLPHLRAELAARGERVAVDPGEVLRMWGADTEGHYRRYTQGRIGYQQQRHARTDQIARRYGLDPLDGEAYAEFSARFDAVFPDACVLFPEARGVIDALRAAGIAVGAVSNAGRDLQERKLRATGLAESLPLLVSVETFGVGKPDPRVFREGARQLGYDPEHVAYVGDEPDLDAQAAALAGLRGVWLRRARDARDLDVLQPAADRRRYIEVGDLTALQRVLALPSTGGTG